MLLSCRPGTSSVKKRNAHAHAHMLLFNLGQSTLEQKHKYTYKYYYLQIIQVHAIGSQQVYCSATMIELNSCLGLKHFSKETIDRNAPLLPHCKNGLSLHSARHLGHRASDLCAPEEALAELLTKDMEGDFSGQRTEVKQLFPLHCL